MPTSSFDKQFVVSNPEDIERLKKELDGDNWPEIPVRDRDIHADSKENVKRLFKKFPDLGVQSSREK
ncbi:hypothetical protein [Microbulbifer epialgicus]|uniref:Uncharacterized protein n=1 Tax=Microbulbifer epialgicus TaxID=393907 RepID=A0ABV4NTI1_9GAMM